MQLPYLNETILSPDGVPCEVLDVLHVDFNQASSLGRKSAETLVKEAQGGEAIVTKNKEGKTESTYIAQKGDAIFVNLDNPDDVYVPGNLDGTRWKFSELRQKGYDIISGHPDTRGVRVKSAKTFKVFPEAVEKPTCIKDAWGAGQHQFLFSGATLKLNDNGQVTGIDKNAFDKTWETFSL
jgi:hypothetical protein